MACADRHQVPAGGALAVDRDGFSAAVTRAISRGAADRAAARGRRRAAARRTGAASSWRRARSPPPAWQQAVADLAGEEHLAFFDAIAPIVHKDSIDFDKAWYQSRYDKVGPGGNGLDYINCPARSRPVRGLRRRAAERARRRSFKAWEGTPYFNGCLPIEVMAERGRETLRHGPMKPVGLTNPRNPDRQALRHRPAAPGQRARHALQHGGFPDEAEARRPGGGVPHHPGAGVGRNSPASAACTATPSSTHHAPARQPHAAQGHAAPALRRADHWLRGLCRECRRGPHGGPHGGGRAPRRRSRSPCRPPPPPSAPSSTTSPAATSPRSTPVRPRSSP